jgi:hypothetical protein
MSKKGKKAHSKEDHDMEGGNLWDTIKDVGSTIGSTALEVAPHVAPYLPLLLGLGAKMRSLEKRMQDYEERDTVAKNSEMKFIKNEDQPLSKEPGYDHDKYEHDAIVSRKRKEGGVIQVAGQINEIGGVMKLGGLMNIAGSKKRIVSAAGVNEIGGIMKIGGMIKSNQTTSGQSLFQSLSERPTK